MTVSFLEKVSPLSGIAAVVLVVVGMVLIGRIDYFPSPERAVEMFTANPGRVQRGALVAGFYAVVFLLWFAGSVFKTLSRGAENSFAPAFALSGGIIIAVGLMLANGIFWVVAARYGRSGEMSPETAVIFNDLILICLANVLSVGLAVLIGATGIGALQTHVLPVWLGWVSIVVAVGLLTPIHYIFEGLGFIWIVEVSIVLYI